MELLIENRQGKITVTPDLEKLVKKVITQVLELESPGMDLEVSVLFVDDREIQEMNSCYRRIDKPTDVLSFAMKEEVGDDYPPISLEEDNLLGDVIISLETAQRQSIEYGHSLEREVGFLTVHGMLHLLSYDHIEEQDALIMRQKEEEILEKLGLKR